MRATLDWDHDLLAEEERVAFRRLGVFVGGFTLESAEAVITDDASSDESTVMHIGQLVEKSLLTVDHLPASEAVRYRMLEPVRQYSLERLAQSGETDSVRSRHADHFGELADHGASGLKGADQLMWLELLDEEYDNVRAGLGYLLEQGNTEQAAQIGWNLWLFWSLRGHVAEGRRWMESLLAREEATSGRGHARALWVLAMFSYMRADFDSMLAMLEEILAADEDLDEETLNQALVLQGHGLAQRGDLDDAEPVLKRGLDLAGLRGDRWYIVHALHGLVHVAMARSDFDTAIPLVRDSLTIAREIGERWALALSLTIYSVIELTRGEDEHAETLLEECTSLSITLRDPFTTAYSLTGLAVIAGRRGDAVRMAHLAGAADALRESKALDIGITIWRALFDEDVGSTRERMGPDEFDLAYARGRSMTPEELVGIEVPIGT
jgi:tetratricopeptide (TPR) repeat protein